MDFIEETTERSKHISIFGHSITGDDPVVVAVSGEVDMFTVPELSATFDDLISAGNRNLVLDLSAVEFMDSSGLRVFMKAAEDVRQAGGSMRVSSASRRVRRIAELAGMNGLLPLPPTSDGTES